ncbi:autotransporter domain-containing protein [Pasteurella oralis]|uniref:Autotransporter domain-containing protein n=1 Tax=Pasteurella oralis TaxID=1071947 RepID=A0ABW4NTY0_9PAST
MKQKYQKIIIPTLSLFFASCGGGSGGESTPPPINHHDSSTNDHSSLPNVDQSENTDLGHMPDSETTPNLDLDTESNSNVAPTPNLDLPLPPMDKNNENPHLHNPPPSSTPDLPINPDPPKLSENDPQTSLPTPNNKDEQSNSATHNIHSSGTLSLIKDMQYIDDENLVRDIAVIDTSYYLSDSFKDENGKLRLQTNNQNPAINLTPYSHGTMVAAVINRYNKTAIIDAYSAYQDTNEIFWVRSYHYDTAHNKGVRIFNNSYGADALAHEYPIKPIGNIVKYAKEDSIFVWAAGNENQNHGTPQSVYPMIDDDARNGWISVAEADYSQGAKSTIERKRYGRTGASNYIGENAKNWGIAAQGTYRFLLKVKESDSYKNVPTTGTSFAAPRVTAAAANIWTKFPWMDHHLVVVSILSTADKPGTFLKGQDGECQNENMRECGEPTTNPEAKFGWGLLNERRALKGPALFDKRLLTNKDAKLLNDDKFEKNINISGKNSSKDLLVVNFDFRHYQDKEKLTWSNDIKGDAGILKQGSGTLYLNGKNQYQGKTIVDGGVLGIGHSLTSEVIINQGGTLLAEFDTKKYNNQNQKVVLGKNENTQHYTVKNNGSLSVYGEGLTINGNYIGNANSRIIIDIDKSKLEVTGTMDLGGSSKIVADVKEIASLTSNPNGIPSQNEKERTIISAQSISNHQNITYAKTNRINNYIDISQFYVKENKEINVKYKRNSTAYVLETINYTPKSAIQTASNIDKVLDTLASSDKYHPFSPAAASLLQVDKAQLPAIIDSLSGEIYASSQQAIINQNLVTNQALSQRVMSVNDSTKNGFWLDGIYAHSKIHQKGYASANAKTTGSQIGFDNKISETLTLGLALNQSTTNTEFNHEAGKSKTKSTTASLYGAYHINNFYLATIAGFNYATNNVNRVVIDKQVESKFNSKIYNFYTELGTNVYFAKTKINPFIANAFHTINRGSFKENVAFGIDAKAKTYHMNSVILGMRTKMTFDKLTLNTSFSHAYTPKHNDFGFDAKFTGFTDTIHIHGVAQSKHISWFGLGASYALRDGLSLQVGYNLSTQGSKKDNELINLGATYQF